MSRRRAQWRGGAGAARARGHNARVQRAAEAKAKLDLEILAQVERAAGRPVEWDTGGDAPPRVAAAHPLRKKDRKAECLRQLAALKAAEGDDT